MNFNKIILAGNLTRDPELTVLPSGTPICKLGMAVNRKWKTQDGKSRDEVLFVDLTAFGKTAETLNQYMTKGKPILVEGRLKFDQWEGKDGGKRSKHSIVIDNFQFVPDGHSRDEQPSNGDGVSDAELPPTGKDIPF